MMRSLLSVASLALLAAPFAASALTLGSAQEPFTLSADPAAPAARGTLTLTPVSGDIDITTAIMTVVMNGTQIYSGNASPINIRVGGAGVVETITVSMKTSMGTYKQVLTVTPQDVSLVAEPLSSAPPLYPGGTLVPVGGSVRVVAVADLRTKAGGQLDPSTLSYSWTIDDATSLGASGVGKRTIIVDSPLEYRSSTVGVTVTSADGLHVASGSLELVASEPTMRIYERDPLMGIRFDHALSGSYTIPGSEATLYGAPFNFPTALGAPLLSWYVAGALAQTGNLITLRPTGQGAGTASLSITGESKGSIDAPAASESLSVSFGSGGGGSFFGL